VSRPLFRIDADMRLMPKYQSLALFVETFQGSRPLENFVSWSKNGASMIVASTSVPGQSRCPCR